MVLGPEEGALYPQGGWEEALSAWVFAGLESAQAALRLLPPCR